MAGEYADKSFAVIPAHTNKVAAADGKFLIEYPQVTRLPRLRPARASRVSHNFPILRHYTGPEERACEPTPGGGTVELVENC